MLGFDPLTISSVLVLASSSAKDLCQMPKPTEINVLPATQKVQFVTNQNLAELQQHQTDTINPYGYNSDSFTQGFAKGKISIRTEVNLNHKVLPRYNAACLWYEKIEVKFDIDPDVHIAKEVYDDRCMRKAVVGHEMKHVMVDRKIVNKYSRQIGQKIYAELKKRGFIGGPIPLENVKAVAERMQRTVMQLVELEQQRMELDRKDLQGQVDTLEEYDRVNSLCPKWEVTPEMLDPTRNASYGRRR